VEAVVLEALHNRLMKPELLAAYCEEYTRHKNGLRREHNAKMDKYRRQLARLAREKDRLIEAIKDGVPGSEVKGPFEALVKRRTELEGLLAQTEEVPVILHPRMADHYRREIDQLITALNSGRENNEARNHLRASLKRSCSPRTRPTTN
jgi:hypothetical protein